MDAHHESIWDDITRNHQDVARLRRGVMYNEAEIDKLTERVNRLEAGRAEYSDDDLDNLLARIDDLERRVAQGERARVFLSRHQPAEIHHGGYGTGEPDEWEPVDDPDLPGEIHDPEDYDVPI